LDLIQNNTNIYSRRILQNCLAVHVVSEDHHKEADHCNEMSIYRGSLMTVSAYACRYYTKFNPSHLSFTVADGKKRRP